MAGRRRRTRDAAGGVPPRQRQTRAAARRRAYEARRAAAADPAERLTAAADYLRAVLRSAPASWAGPIAEQAAGQLAELAQQTDDANGRR